MYTVYLPRPLCWLAEAMHTKCSMNINSFPLLKPKYSREQDALPLENREETIWNGREAKEKECKLSLSIYIVLHLIPIGYAR